MHLVQSEGSQSVKTWYFSEASDLGLTNAWGKCRGNISKTSVYRHSSRQVYCIRYPTGGGRINNEVDYGSFHKGPTRSYIPNECFLSRKVWALH